MSVAEIAKAVDGELINCDSDYITDVSIDTRTLKQGSLFVPLSGNNSNGHDYVQRALTLGATASFWQRDYPAERPTSCIIVVDNPLVALQTLAKYYLQTISALVVAVTGSNGKTTTKDMIASVLAQRFSVHKTQGNYNNHIGVPLTVLQASPASEVIVLEMGMNSFGEIELLSQLVTPDYAVITNVGEAHLQALGSRAGVAKAKCEIVAGLKKTGLLFFNGDEPLLKKQLQNIANIYTFGESRDNDYFPENVKQDIEGISFMVQNRSLFLPYLGMHNVLNGLTAIAIGRSLDLEWSEIKSGLNAVKLTKMRMEVLRNKQGVVLINDAYNANPTSMKVAISFLHELTGFARKKVVLADMYELGEEETLLHKQIGAFLDANLIDYVYTFGEKSEHIFESAQNNFPIGKVQHFVEAKKLVKSIMHDMRKGDVILFKGSRAMRLEEIIKELL